MLDFFLNIVAVTAGIILYKNLENLYDDIRWKFKQRHSSSKDPWDSW